MHCFVTYSHQDIDRPLLEFLLDAIENKSFAEIQFLYDQALPGGANFEDFMQRSETAGAVLLILTPSYKQRAQDRLGGVSSEFSRILARYERNEELRRSGKPLNEIIGYFELIPILMSGTTETSIPQQIKHLKYFDISKVRGGRDSNKGEFRVSLDSRLELERVVIEIAGQINFVHATHSRHYKRERESNKLTFLDLFRILKADWAKVGEVDRLFVKTRAYLRAKEHPKTILVGRKGSGKSTVTQVRNITSGHEYAGTINIQADSIKLRNLYHLTTFPQVSSDFRNVITTYLAFRLTWQAFLFFCILEHACAAKNDGRRVREFLASAGSAKLKELFSGKSLEGTSERDRRNAYFVRSFEELITFLGICIKESQNIASMQVRLNAYEFLVHTFGNQIVDAVIRYLHTSDKPFLLTLDEFDSTFDQFRRECLLNKENIEEASHFELEWLRALLHLVLRPSEDNFGSVVDKVFHFCLTVPKDRFLEIKATERDGYIYNTGYTSLDWTGIELAILLRKRLEEDSSYRIDKSKFKYPWGYLHEVLTEKYPFVPRTIKFSYNGKEEELDLFMYVLRHSFWRPREVLLYYGAIVAVGREVARHRHELGASVIRRAVRDEAFNIIRTEFFKEFDTTVNIETIVEAFRKVRQFCSYEEISKVVHNVEFQVSGGEIFATVASKIRFLYTIGFLGVQMMPEQKELHCMLHEHAFCFNEGELWLEAKKDEDLKVLSYIIHPVFKEYLELDSAGLPLILRMDWDYLNEAEAILQA